MLPAVKKEKPCVRNENPGIFWIFWTPFPFLLPVLSFLCRNPPWGNGRKGITGRPERIFLPEKRGEKNRSPDPFPYPGMLKKICRRDLKNRHIVLQFIPREYGEICRMILQETCSKGFIYFLSVRISLFFHLTYFRRKDGFDDGICSFCAECF